ncbi:hypothetical protein JW960_05655 [candidate division KSB1 bacterium]|nr:hypothetical protein [candidate division KSB1 bacterium]
MKKFGTRFIVTICAIIFALPVFADVSIMSLSDIKPGMRGVGKTIFAGSNIDEFEIEVLDIIKNFAPQHDVIMVQLLGKNVEHTGVVSGMSGSPIYIDGKLIGALAYSFGQFLKDPIAGITPIESMMAIPSKEAVRDKEQPSLSFSASTLLNTLSSSTPDEFLSYWTQQQTSATTVFSDIRPITMPLMCSGISLSVLNRFTPYFQSMGLQPILGGSGGSATNKSVQPFQPGDAIAGVLVAGDISVASTGTVTYVNGNQVLGFGHPFFNKGPVNIPMAQANVLTTLSSYMHSNKFATTGEIVGNIRQDRMPGIMGIIGGKAPIIPVTITYTSPINEKQTYHYEIAADQSLSATTPVYFWLTVLTTLETARLANGDYSMRLNGRIAIKNHEDVVINDLYTGSSFNESPGGGQDIMQAAYDIVMRLIPLLANEWEYPEIEKIDLQFAAEPVKRSVQIERVWFSKDEVLPGDSLTVHIYLRAYQNKAIHIARQIVIPANTTAKRLICTVGSAEYLLMWDKRFAPARFRPTNFDNLVSILNNLRQNNNLYIQLKAIEDGALIGGQELPNLPPTVMTILSEKKNSDTHDKLRESLLVEKVIPTDYGVFGGKSISMKMKK